MRKDSTNIKCSIQRALLGFVTPNLRAVCVDIRPNKEILLIFYYDKQPSEDEEELASLADTEFIADFPRPEFKTDFEIITLSHPKPIPRSTLLIYQRYEGDASKINGSHSDMDLKTSSEKLNWGDIVCSAQKALLGRITENLRGVEVESKNGISLVFFYDKNPSAEEYKLADQSGNIFKENFPQAKINILTFPYPKRMPKKGSIFLRYEGELN